MKSSVGLNSLENALEVNLDCASLVFELRQSNFIDGLLGRKSVRSLLFDASN
jgi:hypothetical protein